MSKLKHPTILSAIRSMSASAAPFFGVKSSKAPLFELEAAAEKNPVAVVREMIRGTQAAAATAEAKRGVPNIQRIDMAMLPSGTDALLVKANVLITGRAMTLETVNDSEFSKAHTEFMQLVAETGGIRQLAERFVMNALNGSILFRNRIGANVRCAVRISDVGQVEVREDQLAPGLRLSLSDILDEKVRGDTACLVDAVAGALANKRAAVTLDVRAYVEMGEGQEVFPSQEMVMNQAEGEGRILARMPRNDGLQQAALHGRKVLCAIKMVDTWYGKDVLKALPIEPYGVDQAAQQALRSGKSDFYSLMVSMPQLIEELRKGVVSDETLFVAAVFMRGGVFSKKEKEKAEKDESEGSAKTSKTSKRSSSKANAATAD